MDLSRESKNKHIIPEKWIHKAKTQADGSLEKYKARYVAKSFKQIEGMDYSETFAPTSKPKTLIPWQRKKIFTLRLMDVKSADLHPKINEEICLEQPSGFDKLETSGKNLVCKLNKSIYVLKQAAKN